MNKIVTFALVTAVLLAFMLGLVTCSRVADLDFATMEQRATRAAIENEALQARRAIETRHAARLTEFRAALHVVVSVMLIGALALSIGGGAVLLWNSADVVLAWGRNRANTFYADETGIFPLVKIRVGKCELVHDPNKATAASTIYTPTAAVGDVTVIPVDGLEPTQIQTAWNAQRVQAIAAAHRPQPLSQVPSPPRQLTAPAAEDAAEPPPGVMLPQRVRLLDLLPQEVSLQSLILGVTAQDDTLAPVTGDMAELVHVAVGGSSGWGKSVMLRVLAYQLACALEKPLLALVDLEGVTFSPFSRCDRLLYPIADTEEDALAIYTALTKELDRRKELFAAHPGVDSLRTYNQQAPEPLPVIVCLTDEATALLADKAVESAARILALRARKYGLWCVFGGQDWKATSIDSAIKNQLSARIHFKALNGAQSRVLLGRSDAEHIKVKGRAMAILPGRNFLEMQTPFLSAKDVLATWRNGAQPLNPMPVYEPKPSEKHQTILQMWHNGRSITAIAEEIYGSHGGKQNQLIQAVIDKWS